MAPTDAAIMSASPAASETRALRRFSPRAGLATIAGVRPDRPYALKGRAAERLRLLRVYKPGPLTADGPPPARPGPTGRRRPAPGGRPRRRLGRRIRRPPCARSSTAAPSGGRQLTNPSANPSRQREGPRERRSRGPSLWSPLAAELGFEPRLSDSESPGLPLPHSALALEVYETRAEGDNGRRLVYMERTMGAATEGRPAAPEFTRPGGATAQSPAGRPRARDRAPPSSRTAAARRC